MTLKSEQDESEYEYVVFAHPRAEANDIKRLGKRLAQLWYPEFPRATEDQWKQQDHPALRAGNVLRAKNNHGTCPICRKRTGETDDGKWYHLDGQSAGTRACFDKR